MVHDTASYQEMIEEVTAIHDTDVLRTITWQVDMHAQGVRCCPVVKRCTPVQCHSDSPLEYNGNYSPDVENILQNCVEERLQPRVRPFLLQPTAVAARALGWLSATKITTD